MTEIKKLETIVLNWQAGYRESGLALRRLKAIKANGSTPWRTYIEVCFDITHNKAYRLIKAAETCEQLERLGFKLIPANMAQAEALRCLDDEDIARVWKAAGPKPTLGKIMKAKAKLFGKPIVLPTVKMLIHRIDSAEGIIKKVLDELPKIKGAQAKTIQDRLNELGTMVKLGVKHALKSAA